MMRYLVLLGILGVAGLAMADDYGWDPASLDIGGQHVLTFRASAREMTPAQRRAIVEFRLTKALTYTEYEKPVQIESRLVNGEMTLHANGVYVLTVTTADARANQSSIPSLARQWGRSLKRTFERVGPARRLPATEAPCSLQ